MRAHLIYAALLAAAPACAIDGALDTDESTADVTGDSAAVPTTELSVRAADTTLWVKPIVARDGAAFGLHGRISRNLTTGTGTAFVDDDPYGAYAQRSARVFEVTYGADELGPLEDGANLFVSFGASNGASLTARALVRPRLVAAAGSSKLAFTPELTPVVVDGTTVYRVQARGAAAMTAVSSSAGTVAQLDAQHVTIDLSRDELLALAGASSTLTLTATIGSSAVARHASLVLAVKTIGLTSGDAYAQWPLPACTAQLAACLTALPAGALDTSSCGDALTVRSCQGQVGAAVDAAAIAQATAAAGARLADPSGFATDASGIVGADRAAALTDALRARVTDVLDGLAGRWYLSATTRDARVAAAVGAAFDRAYARPFELIAPHAPAPGDADVTRQVAADALLQYLTTQDYVHSEWGRSYDQLTIDYRALHVASVRAFRDPPDDIFTDPSRPGVHVYLGQWLGAHTEITIDDQTGAATNVLVELD